MNTTTSKPQLDTTPKTELPVDGVISKCLHCNPQSKGGLGKTLETHLRTSWLDKCGIAWRGYDLDDRHRSFHIRHPDRVKCFKLGNATESKSTFLHLLRNVMRSEFPLQVMDTRAQADALLMDAFMVLDFFELSRQQGISITFFLLTSDDLESMENFGKLVQFASTAVNYVIVKNPLKTDSRLFTGSVIEKKMLNSGAKIIELPAISPATMSAMRNAEGKAKRGISFAEFADRSTGHLEQLMISEVQWAMSRMYEQYDAIADLLLPPGLSAKVSASTSNAASTKKSAKAIEDFGFNLDDSDLD